MATNNKHPRNHSETGSGGHVTGRHFFSPYCWGGADRRVCSPWESAVTAPPQHSLYLELERRGRRQTSGHSPPRCARSVLIGPSFPTCHSRLPPSSPPSSPLPAVTGDQRTPRHSFPFSSLDSWAEGFAVGQGTERAGDLQQGPRGRCSGRRGREGPPNGYVLTGTQ